MGGIPPEAAMAANPFFIVRPESSPEAARDPLGAVAQLARLHAEAVETARLANLLGRAVQAAVALPVFAALTLLMSGGAGLPRTIAWSILVLGASLAVARAYAFAIRQPFERAVLHAFAQDLAACLLYAGFAWGAGAFLALPSGMGAALLFVGVPALTLAVLLRERLAVLLFVAPAAGLTAFACLLRADGAAAGLVLLCAAAAAAAAILIARHDARANEAALPEGLLAA
jgi:hypothetical protein